MSAWLKSILGYMLIVSVSMQMLPNQKYEQYIRLFTGFLLIILILQPILKIGSADVYLENMIVQFVEQQEKMEEEIGEKKAEFQEASDGLQKESVSIVEVPEIIRVEVSVGD